MRVLTLLLVVILSGNSSYSDSTDEAIESERIDVKLRNIGHQILLSHGDSTTRVLPVQFVEGEYIIGFAKPISILPSDLVDAIEESFAQTNLAAEYIVQVKTCDTADVVYSYERDTTTRSDLIQCRSRVLETGCYQVHIRFSGQRSTKNMGLLIIGLMVLGVVIGFALYRYVFKPKTNLVRIGRYRFDTKAMYLVYEGERVNMTTRESDLLHLLYKSINNTVKKEHILKEIWGDEGSYDGRTLDVFISKLRKKLAYDPRVKLVNVKGVGYKMVIED